MKEREKGRNKGRRQMQREKEGVKKRKHIIIPRDHFSFHSPEKESSPLLQPFHQTNIFPSEKSSFARLYHPPQGLTTRHCSPALPMLTYTAH